MDGAGKRLDRVTWTEAVELARGLGAALDDLAAALGAGGLNCCPLRRG